MLLSTYGAGDMGNGGLNMGAADWLGIYVIGDPECIGDIGAWGYIGSPGDICA